MNAAELKSIIQNPSTSPEDRASALAALQSLERDGETRIERRDAKRALDSLNATEPEDDGDFSQENIFRLLRDDGVIGVDDEHLRAVYLADPSTSIWWGRLAFWRDRLKSDSSTLRAFAQHCIQKLADDQEVPADARKAAADLLAAFNQRKAGDPVPAIQIPGNERWKTMPSHELYFQHMTPYKKRLNEVFYTAR